MTLVIVLLEFGAVVVYGAWKNLSIKRLLLGDNQSAKEQASPVTEGQPRK